ncbi:MAG: transposase [Candidatus Omnitrophica bacterium]|nr:transposase [Candidatus Omnitrophota bacterium]
MQKRKTNRLQKYDYSQGGYYFVTICTKGRGEWFGKIENGAMVLNEYGAIAAIYWADIPKYYPGVGMDEWVVMPNHIHGIIVISPVGTEQCSVPTQRVSLSQIIKSFKGVMIKRIRSEFGDIRFAWQRSFYDHVIHNETSLNRIREYIKNNPKQWDMDIENACRTGQCPIPVCGANSTT